ncbi:MAG: BzdV protein, partial [Deltaproteobacteria bacterium]
FTEEAVRGVTEEEGVYRLYDAGHNIIAIKGTATLRRSLLAELEHNEQAAFFDVEEDRMYSQRENELIQRYLQEHGRMPGAGDDGLDDLF